MPVALLVTDEARIDVPSQARARVSLPCDAEPLVRDSTAYGQARADYLARFPADCMRAGASVGRTVSALPNPLRKSIEAAMAAGASWFSERVLQSA
jgi:hypothetical protein